MHWILLIFCAFGLILALPPFPLGFLSFFAFVPFFLAIRKGNTKQAFGAGYLTGLIWSAGTLYWIGWATLIGLIGSLIWLPLFFAIFSYLLVVQVKRWGTVAYFTAPLIWTGLEIINSLGPMAFPWNKLAYSMSQTPVWIQFASVVGAYGVSFWIVLVNVLIFYAMTNPSGERIKAIFASVILLLLPMIHGVVCLSKTNENPETVSVSLIQGNIDPYKKWSSTFIDSNFTVYYNLTDQASTLDPDLIVWPETATPSYIRHRFHQLKELKGRIDRIGIPLLTGAPDFRWDEKGRLRTYNSALFIQPGSWEIGQYDKMKLVPFSEKVPFADRLPFLTKLMEKVHPDIGDFSPGDSIQVFRFESDTLKREVRFSVVICFESVFPDLVRRFVKEGAEFLIVITNDGWFGKTSGPYQHASIAVLRAIENRISIGRCANTGVSEFIDPWGRVVSRSRLNEAVVLSSSLSLRKGETIYTRSGSAFPAAILGADLLILFWSVFASLKSRQRLKKS